MCDACRRLETFSWQTKLMKYVVDATNVSARLVISVRVSVYLCVTERMTQKNEERETLDSITKQRTSEENSFKFNIKL